MANQNELKDGTEEWKRKSQLLKDLTEDQLEAYLGITRYGNFVLTDAVRPAYDLEVVPKPGFRHDVYEDRQSGDRVPVVMASASRETILDLFIDLLDPLGETVDVVLESSHHRTGGSYVTMHEPSHLRLPGEVCGAWETAKGSVAGIYVTTSEEPQSVDDLLKNSNRDDLFKAMGATILSKRLQPIGRYPSVSYLIEGMGHGVALAANGPILTRGRWVLVPQGKQVYCFLFVSPAFQADALNAEFEVILQSLSFGKDNPVGSKNSADR